jgi:predicted acylesterase/phospholipase RssA
LQRDAVAASTTEHVTRDSVIARLVRRAERRGDRTLDILMLSGGGQVGAFGTGFLRGWLTRDAQRLPTFDLITGISTGALQAPYALLGTTAALDTLTELYRNAQQRVAPSLDVWSVFRRTGGLVNTSRYDRALRQSIDGQFRDDLRAAFAQDRQLIIGTSDFDLGIGRTWSLGDVIDTTSASLTRTYSLLKAATAIPGIFPPVVIDGHVHADGGVITNVLPLLAYDDYAQLARALSARGLRDVTVRVYVVMNLWAFAEPRVMSPASRRQMNSRSTAMLFYSHQPQTLELLDNLARAVTATMSGLRVEFRVATIPAELALVPGAAKLFDTAFMQRLDAEGYAKARSASPWDRIPSAYARPRAPTF